MTFPRSSPRLATALASGCACLLGAALANAASSGSGGIAYRWVDEKGIAHYGDHIPQEYAQHESVILNRQGVEIGRLAAPKSVIELQEEARRTRELQQQQQRDNFLLATYASVKDIEQLRDQRLQQLRGQRIAADQYVASLHERLLGLQARAMSCRPYSSEPRAPRMSDDLAEDLVHTLNEVRTQRNTLAAKDQEETRIRAQFQADIDRFQQLRAAGDAPRTGQ